MTGSTSPSRSPNGLLDRAAAALVRRRAVWMAFLVASALGLGALATTLPVRLEQDDFLLRDGDARSGTLSARTRSTLLVVVEADSALRSTEARRILDSLAARLRRVDGVERVVSGPDAAEVALLDSLLPPRALLFLPTDSLRELGRMLEDDVTPEAARRVAGMAAGLSGRWSAGSRIRASGAGFRLPGDRVFLVEVRTSAGDGDVGRARATRAAIQRVAAAFAAERSTPPRVGARVVGYPVTLEAVYARLSRDAIRVGTAAALVVAVMLAAAFRRSVAPVLLIGTVAVGMLATAAAAAVAAESISLATLLFVPLVLGIGVDFGIYLCAYYWSFAPAGASRPIALASAVRRAAPGLAVAALSSAVAALSVAWMPTRVLGEVAILTAVGLVLVLFATLAVLPLLLSFSRPGGRAAVPGTVSPKDRRLALLTALGWIGLCVLLLSAARIGPGLPVSFDQWRSLVTAEPSYAELRGLVADMGVAVPPLEVRSTAADLDEALALDRRAATGLVDLGLRADVAAVQSISRFLPPPEQQRANLAYLAGHPETFAPERLRSWAAGIRDAHPRVEGLGEHLAAAIEGTAAGLEPIRLDDLRRAAPELVDRHISRDDGRYTVTSRVFLRRFPWEENAGRRFSREVGAAGLYDLPGTVVPDPVSADARRESTLRRAALRATLTASIAVTLLLALRFRRARDVVLCLLPLGAALAAAIVAVHLLGLGFSVTSLAILPILVGISVDDGIHVVDRLARGAPVGVVRAEIGGAMLLTTLTTTGALACLALARWSDVRPLGLVGGAGMWAAYGTAVLLVPAAWAWSHRDRGSGRSPDVARPGAPSDHADPADVHPPS